MAASAARASRPGSHRPAGRSPRPAGDAVVNRFALFSEMLLGGVIVLVLSVPLVTAPAAFAAGAEQLRRHLEGRADSPLVLLRLFREGLAGAWLLGAATAGASAVVVLNLLLGLTGMLPARGLVLPATAALAAGLLVAFLRTTAAWRPERGWAAARAEARAMLSRDWTGNALLAAAVGLAAVFVWMLPALLAVAPGTLVLAAVSVRYRALNRSA